MRSAVGLQRSIMYKYYTIRPIHTSKYSIRDTIIFVANMIGATDKEILDEMGYDSWFDYYTSDHATVHIIARKLNDICKEYDLRTRIGGPTNNGVSTKRSIFR